MRKDFRAMLQDPHKKIDQTGGLLSMIWRKILADRKIGMREMESLMQRHIDEEQRKSTKNAFDKSSTWNNLARALVDPDNMSWKTIMRGINILPIVKIKVVFIPTWTNGDETQHGAEFVFRPNQQKPSQQIPSSEDKE